MRDSYILYIKLGDCFICNNGICSDDGVCVCDINYISSDVTSNIKCDLLGIFLSNNSADCELYSKGCELCNLTQCIKCERFYYPEYDSAGKITQCSIYLNINYRIL